MKKNLDNLQESDNLEIVQNSGLFDNQSNESIIIKSEIKLVPQDFIDESNQLNGIKCLAILLLIGYNFNIPGFYAGYLGVDIFLVLNGYLITVNILREFDEQNQFDLIKFWSKRIFFLAPPLFFLLFSILLWNNSLNQNDLVKKQLDDSLFPCLFYYSNWFFIDDMVQLGVNNYQNGLLQIWSLSLEDQFYFFWPQGIYLVIYMGEQQEKPVLVMMTITFIIISISLFFQSRNNFLEAQMSTVCKMFVPLTGSLMALYTNNLIQNKKEQKENVQTESLLVNKGTFLISFYGLIACFILFWDEKVEGQKQFGTKPSQGYFFGGALLVSLCAAIFIAFLDINQNYCFNKLIGNKVFTFLGKISYSLYLWHLPVGFLVQNSSFFQIENQGIFQIILIKIFFTLFFSSLSYFFIELIFQKYKNKNFKKALLILFLGMIIIYGWNNEYQEINQDKQLIQKQIQEMQKQVLFFQEENLNLEFKYNENLKKQTSQELKILEKQIQEFLLKTEKSEESSQKQIEEKIQQLENIINQYQKKTDKQKQDDIILKEQQEKKLQSEKEKKELEKIQRAKEEKEQKKQEEDIKQNDQDSQQKLMLPKKNHPLNFMVIGDSVPCQMIDNYKKYAKQNFQWISYQNCESACPLALIDTSNETYQQVGAMLQQCFKIFKERYNIIEQKNIELVLVHTRSDWVSEYTMVPFQKTKSPQYMSTEWKKMLKQNYLDEINKLKSKKVLISYVLFERLTHKLPLNQVLYPLIQNWEFVEEINSFIKQQEDQQMVTIDLNPIVCEDNLIPCKDKFTPPSGRIDGLHYQGQSKDIVSQFILEQTFLKFNFNK